MRGVRRWVAQELARRRVVLLLAAPVGSSALGCPCPGGNGQKNVLVSRSKAGVVRTPMSATLWNAIFFERVVVLVGWIGVYV